MAEIYSESEDISLITSNRGFLIKLNLSDKAMDSNFSELSEKILELYKKALDKDFNNNRALDGTDVSSIYLDYLVESDKYLKRKKNNSNSNDFEDNQPISWMEEL